MHKNLEADLKVHQNFSSFPKRALKKLSQRYANFEVGPKSCSQQENVIYGFGGRNGVQKSGEMKQYNNGLQVLRKSNNKCTAIK